MHTYTHTHIRKVLEKDKCNVKALARRAQAYIAQGDLLAASADYNRLLELAASPDPPTAGRVPRHVVAAVSEWRGGGRQQLAYLS